MRTTLNLAVELFDELIRLTGERTRTAAVNRALREYLAFKRRQAIKSLSGRIRVDLDWKALRALEIDEA